MLKNKQFRTYIIICVEHQEIFKKMHKNSVQSVPYIIIKIVKLVEKF